jgi:hypothetical protein
MDSSVGDVDGWWMTVGSEDEDEMTMMMMLCPVPLPKLNDVLSAWCVIISHYEQLHTLHTIIMRGSLRMKQKNNCGLAIYGGKR